VAVAVAVADAMPRTLHLAISLAILVLACGAGLWTAAGSIGPPAAPPPAFAAPASSPLDYARRIPAFRWRGDGRVERIGSAGQRPDRSLGLLLYPGRSAAAPGEQTVLLDASVKTLWDLGSRTMSRDLSRNLQGFLHEGRRTLTAVVESPAFVSDYEPAFRRIGRESIEAAWQAPETRLAARAAFAHYGDELLSDLVPPLLPVLLDNVQQALRESFAAQPARFLGQLIAGEIDRVSLSRALDRTLQDPDVAARLDRGLTEALAAAETEALARAFARALLRELSENDELFDLLEQLVADARFGDNLAALKQHSLEEVRNLAELLLGLGVDEGVHPVTAVVIRSFLGLEGPHFVLVVPGPLARRLTEGELPGGELLHPLETAR